MNRVPASYPVATLSPGHKENYELSRRQVGYVPRSEATRETYFRLGFKSGLEIHQQLLTQKKLFCHCPAGLYQHGEYDAEVIRHMRPTLSEMGEYDGTALMEKKTRKTIIYRIKDETACTYDIDDTPPFQIDRDALEIALEIALMLKCNMVGELHIARKQYLDGSIPTGFQRTGIVGIEGEIPLAHKKVRIIQISIEEDSCREVSDVGHLRVYTTDRLGMPLIETVTYPDMLTPDEVAEAAQYLRLLVRTSGKVRTGIGAAREDVNVSIAGGTRVEIKGVQHIRWIPDLVHVEAFRQKALLRIRDILQERCSDHSGWRVKSVKLDSTLLHALPPLLAETLNTDYRCVAVNLPAFRDILSHFTQPGKCFASELSDRLKVIACLERPNLIHSEGDAWFDNGTAAELRRLLGADDNDAQLVYWGPADDMATALETVEERCRLAFAGVPNETRKSFSDGTTIFERVLPGPDRMYPDTDSAPIAIANDHIERIRARLIDVLPDWLHRLRMWGVPSDTHRYLIRREIVPVVEQIAGKTGWPEKFIAVLFGHTLKGLERKRRTKEPFEATCVVDLCLAVHRTGLERTMAKEALYVLVASPDRRAETVVSDLSSGLNSLADATRQIPALASEFERVRKSRHPEARQRWIMGRLKPKVVGKVDLKLLAEAVTKELAHV
ncbi:MAG: Glu-tRNA(Gln) amidotransferase subunit GatE [Candidatus Zixiibacteriota bacterium]